MKKNNKAIFIFTLLGLAIVFLVWGAMSSSASTWKETSVQCLPGGHTSVAVHIHPTLSITVDGEQEQIPAETGINAACMAEVHTHDASGELHVEVARAGRIDDLTLSDFFDVWGQELQRDGYELTARVDGEEVENPGALQFEDRQQIELAYTSISEEQDDESSNLTAIAEACETQGGTWIDIHSECEISDEQWCTDQGGQFESCASACRNDPEADVCTEQCVRVCNFTLEG